MTIKRITAISTLLLVAALDCVGQAVPPAAPVTPNASVTPAAPVPEPVITEIDTDESANRPRRSGWWSRRSAGG